MMESDSLLELDMSVHEAFLPWINNTGKAKFLMKGTSLRVVVGLVCGLSIIGSILIILAYIVFKSRRSRTREILVNISIMDFGVALSNLVGLSVYFDKYYYEYNNDVPAYIDGLCKTQTFFAAFCTYGSVFWTITLAAYVYLLLMQYSAKTMKYFLASCYIVCYGLPIVLSMWLMFTGRFGYSPLESAGWCSLIAYNPNTGDTDLFVVFFAYDFWIYLAIVLIPLFYISTRCYVAQFEQVKRAKKFVDYRFLLIPIIFLLLRIWTTILSILYDYIQVEEVPNWINQVLLYLSGIGDSGQGFANAILFLLFSKSIRQSVIQCIRCKKPIDRPSDEERLPSPSPMASLTTTTTKRSSKSSSTSSSSNSSRNSPVETVPVLSDSFNGRSGGQGDQFHSYRHNYGTLN